MRKLLPFLLLALAGFFLVQGLKPPVMTPGALLATQPLQFFWPSLPFKHDGYTLLPIASYQIDARVLSRRLYADDEESAVSPVDLALGWGPMSRDELLEKIQISQGDRFFFWQAADKSVEHAVVRRNAANVHIIPATPQLKGFLSSVSPNQYLALKGSLVYVYGGDGWQWHSSLSREDSGDGACEVFYVRSAELFQPGQSAVGKSFPSPASSPPALEPLAPQPSITRTPPISSGEYTLQADLPIRFANGRVGSVPAASTITIIRQLGGNTQVRHNGMTFWVKTGQIR